MATVTDRPKGEQQAPFEPVPQAASAAPGPATKPAPRRSRLVGGIYLLAPITAALAGLLAILAVALAIALNLGTGQSPPATGAAKLVPANSLLYLHLSTDASRPAVRQALVQARRFPDVALLYFSLTSRLDSLLAGSSNATVDFGAQVRPWLGREAAFAALDTTGSAAGTLVVLDVRSRPRARAFLIGTGALPDGSYRHVPLLRQSSGTVLAFVGHYLVLGQASSVASAIDVEAGRAPSLADSAAYGRAAAGEPADRVVELYAPVAGVRRALVPRQGLLGALGTLLDQPALSAVALTVSPDAGGFSIRAHSALDPQLAAAAHPSSPYSPGLPAALPAGSVMMIDGGSLRGAAPKLLAAAAQLGVAGRAAPLLAQLGSALSAQGVNLDRVFSQFGQETALAVVPGRGGTGPVPVIVARTSHPVAARAQLGDLEGPLTAAFSPPATGAGVAPEVTDATLAGATVSELTLAPGFQLDWAVAQGLIVVSTRPQGIAAVLRHRVALDEEPAYRAVLAAAPGQVTSLVFFDPAPLLRLGEQTGLIGTSSLASLRPDLEPIRAIGLASTGGGSDTTTQLQLQIR